MQPLGRYRMNAELLASAKPGFTDVLNPFFQVLQFVVEEPYHGAFRFRCQRDIVEQNVRPSEMGGGVQRAYEKRAQVTVPSLEDYEEMIAKNALTAQLCQRRAGRIRWRPTPVRKYTSADGSSFSVEVVCEEGTCQLVRLGSQRRQAAPE